MILVVDDDATVRELVTIVLARAGYDVVAVDSAETAFAALAAAPCDLIVSDLNLPGASGLDLLAHLRWNGSALPFVLLTAADPETYRARAAALGVAAVLGKPFPLPALRDAVDAALRRRSASRCDAPPPRAA